MFVKVYAEVKIGDLLKDVPKETNNNPQGKNQHNLGQKDTVVPLTIN